MEEQQPIQQLAPQQNGKYPQPLLPIYTPTQENKTEEWDLRQVLTVVRRRAVVIGSVAIAICTTVWLSTLTTQPKYEGKFGLLVEPPVTAQSKLEGLSDIPGINTNSQQEGLDYNTQILVLQSPELMAPIIKQLSTRYPNISYSSLIGNLKITRLQETKILEVRYQDSDPQKIQFVLQQLSRNYLKYSLQERQASVGQGIQFVDLQMPQLQARVNSLQRELQRFRQQYNFIDPGTKADQLSLQVSNVELQRQDIQKQLAEAHAFYAILHGRSGIQLAESGALNATSQSQSSSELAQTLASDTTSQSQSSGEVTDPRASDTTSQSQSGGEVTDPRASDTTSHQSGADQVQTRSSNGSSQGRSSTQAQVRSIDGTSQRRSGTAPAQNEGPLYQRLMGQLRDVDTQIAAELPRFRENSPYIQELRQKRANLLPVLRQEAKRVLGIRQVEVANQISGLEVQRAKIAQVESNLNQQVKQLPNLVRQYTDLQRQLKIATESLNRFLEKRESLQIETAQKEIPWQVIAPPQLPQVPVSPNVPRNLILGVVTGLLAGLGAALLVERLDNVFHSPDDLREVTKLPILGMIPFHKNLKRLNDVRETDAETRSNGSNRDSRNHGSNRASRNNSNSQNYSYFPFLEAFRSLHTNIGFLGSDTPINSLVISSALHAEGKSTVALHLAQAAAAMGKRVLLVDADLRLPEIHNQLGLQNVQGLSNVISTNLPVLEVIQRSPLSDNLFVLTSGQIPPDPTKLLSSKKMQNIMQQLRESFDLVIYDTPPLLGLADSSLLATYTAGIVLVVRTSKTDRSTLLQALDRLKVSRAPVLGTVCNGVKNNHGAYAYNYYYRSRTPSAQVN